MENSLGIVLPKEFIKVNSMPDDPENSSAYVKQTSNSINFIMVYPISKEASMPFDNEKTVITGIHGALGEHQGLIEVKSGITQNGKRYIYSIVKSKKQPSGIQYVLTMHIDNSHNILNIQGFFDENGMTGFRDTTIMNKLISEGKIVSPNMDNWMQDPYDLNYKKGLLMNASENAEYDSMFPNHPLSEMRMLIKYLVANN